MAATHAALVYWTFTITFMIILAVRLDGSLKSWNWYSVFVPMWILDAITLVFHVQRLIRSIMYRSTCGPSTYHVFSGATFAQTALSLALLALKFTFQLLLCIYLELEESDRGRPWLPFPVVMAPLWLLLACVVVRMFVQIYRIQSSSSGSGGNNNNNNAVTSSSKEVVPPAAAIIGGSGTSNANVISLELAATDSGSARGPPSSARTGRSSSQQTTAAEEPVVAPEPPPPPDLPSTSGTQQQQHSTNPVATMSLLKLIQDEANLSSLETSLTLRRNRRRSSATRRRSAGGNTNSDGQMHMLAAAALQPKTE